MTEILQILADFICLVLATFGAFAVAGMLKDIKETQEYIMFRLDNIEDHIGKERMNE